MTDKIEEEVNIKKYTDLVLRYKYVIGSIIILFLIIGFVLYKLEVPVYSSTITLTYQNNKNIFINKYVAQNKIDGNIIKEMAVGYETVSQMIKELDLSNEIIIPDILTIIKMKLGLIENPYSSFLERINYYKKNIRVNSNTRSAIVKITVTDQNPKNAAKIANKIAEILLDKLKRENEAQVNKGINYLDKKINTINELLDKDRKKFISLEASEEYNVIVELQEKIQSAESMLNNYQKKVKQLTNQLALEFRDDNKDWWKNDEKAKEKKESWEYEKEHYEKEIESLVNQLEEDRKVYAELDKTNFYEKQAIEARIRMDEGIYNGLIHDKQQAIIGQIVDDSQIKFLSRALQQTYPDRLKGIKNIITFFILGCVASGGVAFTLQFFDRRFTDSQEVEEELGLNVLGSIPKINPKNKDKITNLAKSSFVEAYKTLRTNIHFADKSRKLKILGITSAEAGTGKSFTVKNLANIMAGSGDSVLVIDCDLRKPSIHTYFNIKRKPGLTDVLVGNARLDEAIIKVRKNLYTLPSGSLHYNPQEVLESSQMKELLNKVKSKFDIVLCDSIPVLTASDAEILSSLVDSNLLIINLNSSKKNIMKAKDILNKIRVPILGAVVNNKKKRSRKSYYYYYHYYKK